MRTSCELGWRGVTPMAIKRTKKADPVHVVVKVDGRRWRQVLSTPPAAASRVRVTSWPSRHTTELATRFGRRVRNLIIEHGAMLGLELSEGQHRGRPRGADRKLWRI